jgi:capsule polysaccharide export protein KpsE/RkpR
LVIYNKELVAQNQEIMTKGQMLQASHDQLQLQLHDSLMTIKRGSDSALGHALYLQHELATAQSPAENVMKEAHESMVRSNEIEAGLRQSMSDLKHACDLTIAQERADADQARSYANEDRKQVSALRAENNDLQNRIGMAMRDAQKSSE